MTLKLWAKLGALSTFVPAAKQGAEAETGEKDGVDRGDFPFGAMPDLSC